MSLDFKERERERERWQFWIWEWATVYGLGDGHSKKALPQIPIHGDSGGVCGGGVNVRGGLDFDFSF